MRYEDASSSFSSQGGGTPDARDDADALPAGSRGPATGNTITGEGTITGAAGADVVTDGPGRIVSVEGAGGSDSGDGSLNVEGRFGELTLDSRGGYSYTPHAAKPDGGSDVFRYTLADADGDRDTATLTIDIGREIEKIEETAQQIVPGPDGVVTLPPGVELSDIMVVGRNLVINMPDGTQMVIIDGAVFVPQLVLGGVEVPASNLAALLIDFEPKPAAGTPLSSGGNFAVPVPPLDPGVPLGDLIPPTELVFTPPTFQEVGQFVDRKPEAGVVSVQLDDDAKVGGIAGGIGDDPDSVNVTGVLPGSGGDGTLTFDLLTTGAPSGFTYVDGPNGSILVQQVQDGNTVTVLTITINPATGAYTVVQNAAIRHPTGDNENNVSLVVSYTVTDQDGDVATGTITVNVDDDTPTVSVTAGSDAAVLLTTHDALTIGAGSESVSTTANFSGVFSGTTISPGADGAGSGTTSGYALSTTGGASGLTQGGAAINLYNVGGVIVGSTAATSGGITAANTVFTVSVSGTGVVTLTQFSQIDHTNADPTPSGAPFDDHSISLSDGSITLTRSETVVDRDGDSVTGSASVGIGANLRFLDDGPTISLADRGEPTLTVDETNLAANATASFAANFSAAFGADGPAASGSITYALGISAAGANSGLVDVATGQPIVLVLNGGVVEGHVGTATGALAFTVSVNASGNVTLDQIRALTHPDASNPDDSVTLSADTLVTLTATARDFDGDTDSETLNIGTNLVFRDDGPSLTNVLAGAGVLLDETTAVTPAGFPISATSASAAITATQTFGADGAGSVVYGLSLAGGASSVASGLQTAIGDYAITLVQVDADTIEGRYSGTNVAFTIQMNANGTVTVTQNVPLEHVVDGPPGPAHDDPLDLNNLVNATITITDRDGDSTSASASIGDNIVFEDDGPSIDVTAGADAAVLLTTDDAQTIGGASDTASTTANFSGVFGLTFAGGADGAATPSLTYTLGVSTQGVNSGLTQGGAAIYLYVIGGEVVGSTSATQAGVTAANTVFDVSVNASGEVTLTQFSQIDHPIGSDPSATTAPFADHIVSLADGLVTLTASGTVTDNDGDFATDSATVSIGANLRFTDDGPSLTDVRASSGVTLDETTAGSPAGFPISLTSASAVISATQAFGADGPAASGSVVYGLALVSSASGLQTAVGDHAITLVQIDADTIQGQYNGTNVAFTIQMNANGTVTLTQNVALEHIVDGGTAAAHDDSLNLAGLVNATVTIKDFDGDTATASTGIGSSLVFKDDGPDAQVDGTASADVLVLDETIPPGTETDGDSNPPGLVSVQSNFANNFVAPADHGADGPGTVTYSLVLSGSNVASGLYALEPGDISAGDGDGYGQGSQILLNQSGNTITGSVGSVNYFTISIDPATGIVTFTQLQPIWHSSTASDDDTSTLTAAVGSLLVRQTVTDSDGDFDTADIDVSRGTFQIEDDGPVAVNDSDAVGAPGTTATGNVITDAEGDGGRDDVGADVPGRITQIQGFGGTDTTFDGSGNLQVNGQYGVLTIKADGSYVYTRNAGTPGGVNDVFTYTLTDADGDSTTATLTIAIANAVPVLTAPPAVQLDDDNALGVTGNPGGPDDDAVSGTSGTLSASGGDGDIDFYFSATQTAPAGFTYNVTTGATTQTLTITQTSTGLVVTTVTLTNETGAYSVVQNNPVSHETLNGGPGDNTENNTPNFNVSLVARDADNSASNTVNLVINIDDDTPVSAISLTGDAISHDETAGNQSDADDVTGPIAAFSGVATPGDDPDVAGTGPIGYAISTGAVVSSTGSSVGADTPGTTAFSLNVSAAGVDSGLDVTSGESILLYKEGSLIVGRVSGGTFDGKAAFAISIDPVTGQLSMVQYLSIKHPNPLTPDESVSIASGAILATVTVTDADGDAISTSTAIGSLVSFQDDAPIITAASNINIQNDADPAHTGTFAFNLGADGPPTNNNVITNVTFSATVNGNPVISSSITETIAETATSVTYGISFTYATGPGTPPPTATTTGTLTFNKAAGTYTVDLDAPIQGFTTVAQTATGTLFQGYEPGTSTPDSSQPAVSVTQVDPTLFVQFTGVAEPGSGTGANNLVTKDINPTNASGGPADTGADASEFHNGELFTQEASWVSTSNDANGVAGDTIQGGEVLDFNLYSSNPFGTVSEPTDSATTMFLKFDGIGTSEDLIVILKLYDTSTDTYTTKALIVQNSDIQKGPGAGPGLFSGVTLDNNDGLIVIEPNDYQEGNTNLVIVGAQIAGSDEGIIGTGINFNNATGAGGASVGTQTFDTDVDGGPMKISSIGFLTQSTTGQTAELTFNVTIQDGDGDTVSQTLTATVTSSPNSSTAITLSPSVTTIQSVSQEALIEDTSSFSLMSSDSVDQQRTMSAANNNSVLLGAIAAAGLGIGTAAAAQDFTPPGLEVAAEMMATGDGESFSVGQSDETGNANGNGFAGETREVLEEGPGGSPTGHSDSAGTQSLTDGGRDHGQAPSELSEGTELQQSDPAQSTLTSAAVGMPSAEMLANANENALDGPAQGKAEVGRVLADALAGGGDGPSIDAVLDAVANQGPGDNAALEALASHGAAAVSAWHTAGFAGFPGGHSAVTVDPMLHHDAVPAA